VRTIINTKYKLLFVMLFSLFLLTGLFGCSSFHSGGNHRHFSSNPLPEKMDHSLANSSCHTSITTFIMNNKPLMITSDEIQVLKSIENSEQSLPSFCQNTLSYKHSQRTNVMIADNERHLHTLRIRV